MSVASIETTITHSINKETVSFYETVSGIKLFPKNQFMKPHLFCRK